MTNRWIIQIEGETATKKSKPWNHINWSNHFTKLWSCTRYSLPFIKIRIIKCCLVGQW
jgi:hypothetical protein